MLAPIDEPKEEDLMGLAVNRATFMRKAGRSLHFFLAFILAVSTLSAISVFTAPTARALSNSDCSPYVSGLNASGVASGNDCIITFTSGTGTWTAPAGVTSYKVLVVGGGGGGGADAGGGGGGGGVFEGTIDLATQTNRAFSITVGAGGLRIWHTAYDARYPTDSANNGGTNGGHSKIEITDSSSNLLAIQSNGGTKGTFGAPAACCAAGGGGGTISLTDNSSSLSYSTITNATGGTGGTGFNFASAGNGGNASGGYSSSSNFTGMFGGGGGGGADIGIGTFTGGSGANGGGVGGSGTDNVATRFSSAGTVNTGGGGGAGSAHAPTGAITIGGVTDHSRNGAPGGSGVVIVRYVYPIAPDAPSISRVVSTATSAAITYVAPSNTGTQTITSYSFEISTNNGSTWSSATCATNVSNVCTITGLTLNPHGLSRNQYRVSAVSIAGTSPASAAANGWYVNCGTPPVPQLGNGDYNYLKEAVSVVTYISSVCSFQRSLTNFTELGTPGSGSQTVKFDPAVNSTSYFSVSGGVFWTGWTLLNNASPTNVPTFGTANNSATTATIQVSNFDSSFTYSVTGRGCSASINSSTGLISASSYTNLSCSIQVTTTKTGFAQAWSTAYVGGNRFSVSFQGNGNTGGSMSPQIDGSGATLNLTANAFTRSGYTFSGWNTDANGTGTAYADQAPFAFTSNVILRAQWTANTNTVVFDANGGSGSMSNQSITSGTATTLTSNAFSRTGYSFTGWNTAANGSGTSYTNGQSVTITAGMTLYAQWSATACVASSSTSASGYTTQIFTSNTSCIWTAPNGISETDVLVVAGGGGGAGTYTTGTGGSGGGGGGGGAYLANGMPLTAGQSILMTVGRGGAGGITTSSRPGSEGSQGEDSAFGSITAGGGGGGGCATTTTNNVVCTNSTMSGRSGTAGGSGGGATPPWNAYNWGAAGTGSSVTIGGKTFAAQTGYIGAIYNGAAGSGGGARGAATTSSEGAGLVTNMSGSSAEYGRGGRGSNQSGTTFNASTSGYGTGGDGAVVTSNPGAAGASGAPGIVIVKYANVVNFTYDANTGTGTAPAAGSAQGGTAFTTAANPFSRTGYAFTGWNTAANGTGSALTASASNTMPVSATSIVFYAQWSPSSVSITTPTTGLTGTVGTSFTLSISKSGGSGSGDFSLASGTLPAGLSLNTSTGAISGTPTTGGTSAISVRFTDTTTAVATTSSFSIVINAQKLGTPASLAASTVTGAGTAVTITFNSVSNASSYTVQLFNAGGTQIGSNYTNFISGSKISGLTAGTAYSVKVLAVGDGTSYSNSDISSAATVTTPAAYSLSFAGTTSQYASSTQNVIPSSGSFTVETWISPTTYSSIEPVIFSQGTSTGRIYVKLGSNGRLIVYRDAGVEITCSSSAIPLNLWTHIAIVNDSNTLKCYVNGTLQTGNSPSSTLGSSNLNAGFYIGAYSASFNLTQHLFRGQIDELKVWNVARTQTQIQNNAEVAPDLSDSTLVAYYPLDASSGTTAIELKSGSSNLTLATSMSWTALIRTIAYNAGSNGTGTTSSQTGVSDHTTSITLKNASDASGLSRTGYSISAWNTNADGSSGTSYALAATYSGTTNLTLYPTWSAISVSITTPSSGLTGTVGSSYSLSLSKSGGSGSGSFSISTGSLQAGLSLNTSTGVISGTPTAAGTATITARFTDTNTAVATTSSFSIAISAQKLASPSAPTVTAVSGSGTTATVTFASVSNASSYTVQVFDSSNNQVGSDFTLFSSGGTLTGLTSATTYTVKVIAVGNGTNYTNSDPSSGSSVTTTAIAVAPVISSQPKSIARLVGETATFSVTASVSDSGVLSYQWTKDGTNISGATSATYSFTVAGSSDAAVYRVVVTNTKNGVTSSTDSTSGIKLVVSGANNHRNFARNNPTEVFSPGNSFNSSSAVIPSGSFTYEGWFKEGSTVTNQNPIFFQGSLNSQGFGLLVQTSTVRKLSFYNGGFGVTASPEILLNNWYHYAITYDSSSSTIKLFLNGVEVGSQTSATPTLAGTFTMGKNNYYSDHFFHGQQDQVKIWTSALTATEIASSMHAYGEGGITGKTLRTLYDFNHAGTTSTLTDVLGGFNLSANGSGSSTWISSSLNVTFDEQGGSSVSDATFDTYTKIADPGSSTKTGYTLAGWSTTANGSAISFPYIAPPLSAITLYAIWTANSNIVTFNANDGSGSPATATQSITSGTATALTANSFTRAGYTFAGWDTQANGSGTDYTNQQSITITSSFTLYAQWTVSTFAITLAAGTNGTGTNQTLTKTSGTDLTLPNSATANGYFTRTGYSVSGWSTTNGGSQTHALGGSFTTDAATTLYPVWTANTLTVTFDSKGGSSVSNGSVAVGATLSSPTAPTKLGSYFLGWSATDGGVTVSFPYTHGQTANFTLYAIWTVGVYSTNLRVNLDATNRNSLASGSPTTWSSIAPGSSFTSVAYRGTFAPSATPGSFTSAADSFVSFGHQTAARITGDITVEAWLKLNSSYTVSGTVQDVASHYFDHSTSGKDANSMDWFLRIQNGRLILFTSSVSGVESSVQSGVVIASSFADKWIQIGFTQLANGTVQFFLNGAPTGSALSANARRGSTTARLLLGNGSSSTLGSISKFRMYAEALTTSQIKSNFNLEAAGFSLLEIRDLTIDSGSYSSSYTATATPPTITATASAGTGSITFASSTTAVCTVNSSTGVVAFVTAGTCTVSATIAADSTYDSAISASVSITVTLATRTLSIDSGSYSSTYAATATPPTITSTASAGTGTKTYSSSTTSVCTINSSTGVVAFVTSGTCTLAASIAASTTHASATASSVSFTVSLATQTVTWSPTLSILATASPATPSALASALGSAAITYAVQSAGTTGCTVNSSTAVLTFTAPGSCTVRATAGATTTYAVGTVDAVFTIAAASLSDPSTPTAAATLGTLKSIAVSWTAVTNASSYTLKLYATNGSTLHATITGLSGTSRTITAADYSSLADNTAYKVSITAIGTGNYSSSNESSKASVTTASGYTLTYSYDGATSGNSDSTTSFVTGATAVTLPVPAKTGYAFDGWFEASDLSGTKLSSTYTPTQTRTLYAKWIANTLVVTYDAQGGTTVIAGSVVTGANLTAPTAPTKAGYTFSGWSTTSTGSVVSFTGGYAHGQTASFTLYAIWAANALTVTYDSKGGTSVANGTVNTGASISAAPTAPTKTGYTLSGWSATETGTVVTFPYAHNQTASFTLYAIWTGNTNTITYNSKGGSSVADGSFVTGGTIASAPTAPTRAGYTLSGWSLTDGGSIITYPYTPVATAGITLYAIWSGVSCSPTSSTTGGYTIYTFTTAGTCFWTVPNGLTDVEILAVGGGGGGGYAWDNAGAGGGGGGQVKTGTATLSTTLEVTVGAGGTAGVLSSTRGGTGGSTVVSTLTALGGTGGCAARATTCSNSAQATSLAAGNGGVGGSGGASGKGGGGSNTSGSLTSTTAGGTGTASSYSGSSVTYGVGGNGGTARGLITSTNIAGTAGSANTGNGGGGASAKSSSGEVNGGAGGSGLVVIRVASALTITFDSQSGSAVSDGSTLTGASIATAPTDPTRTNYTFLGWFTATSGGSAISFPYAHGQTANFTLYARWALNTYAIAFNANNGSGTMANQTITHGTAVNLNANLYTRANYVFHRWATAADGTGTTYNNLAQVTLTAGATLYAQWTANTYVVTYSYNNATGGNSTATSSFTTGGTAIVLPTPTRTGYTFAGWFSDAGLSSSIGLAGANYSPAGSTLSLNAYAKWTAVDYTFTYDGNSADSGSVPTETSKQITQTATVSANTGSLVRAGYTFSGWNTQSNGGGTTYLSGSIFTVQSSNVTLYAKWTANTYTVTYNVNGGTGNAQRTISSVATNVSTDSYTTGGASIALPGVGTLERAGYTFGGWNTSASGTGTNRLEAATYTTVSDVTLYAKWNAVTYSITYDANTGTGTAPTTGGYTTGQASPYSVLNNTFTKTSNVFGGWNTASNGTGTSYSPGATITTLANIVLYATWIPQYTLHYAINGGTVTSGSLPGDQLYNTGTSVGPVFSSVSRTGYNFGGWSNGSTTVASGGSFIIAADSVLTAIWNPINYVISYESDGGSTAPSSITKQIGQSYTVGAAVSKPGYNFAGWSNGSSVVGAGAGIVMGSSDVTYTAQWVAKIYTISYDWSGGRGTAVSDVNYTFGTSAITLPLVGDRVKDGYTFAGWSESSNGSALSLTYTPSQSKTLYALWNIGNFTVTYDAGRGTVANSTVAVLNGGSTVLPLPTRANFVFNGWHTAVTGGSSVGSNGASFTPTSSQTIYARWIQSSLYGITDSLSRIGSVVTSSNIANTFSGANSNSSVAVSIPANALPAGTTINFDLVSNSSRATGILSGVNYLVSIALSWLTGDETVPDTASDKPITVTISNSSIKAGAAAYAIVNNVSTLLGTATQDGVITVSITSDPEIVVAATKPTAPTNVAATSNGNQQSVISWSAPSSDGGSAITGYTVTANTGATCTTSTTSCTISSLTNGTAYTFTVTATNTVGTSVASTSASGTTASLYTVTFDAKGGTSVTNGSFLTASTVSEPTAPTRTGYSFAGWAATDGGSAEVFPYAPGVTTNITMYARWDALDNVVTFDSKSGSAVADGIFSSGGTVTQPTAPTRSGYTFAGWSATDGGAVVTFPYAPGVVTDITLYAKWTVASQNSSGGGGGGSSAPAPSEPSGPVNPVKSNVTVVPPVIVVGDQETKGIAVQITTPSTGSEVKPPAIKLDAASEKFIAEVKVVEGKLVLTPETGFSGKKTVTVTVTENGADRVIQIPLTVLPEPVTKPVLTPTASNKTIIRWTESPNADAYSVYLNGKKICSTEATSCSINRVLGPDADIQIISNGGDRTISTKAEADFKQNVPVQITRLVSATVTKATLTRVDTKALDKVIALIKTQGFGTVLISEITTTSKTKALAEARIAAIKKYIDAKTGSEKITFEVVPATSRTYFNNIAVKG